MPMVGTKEEISEKQLSRIERKPYLTWLVIGVAIWYYWSKIRKK
jgi:hypothetical protein